MISKHFETLKMVKFAHNLPNETNLNIQFCLIIFVWAFKKSLYLGFLVLFCDFSETLRPDIS